MQPLCYTSHPLFDIGLAAIVAFVDKRDPVELTIRDLEKVATYIEDYYVQQPLTTYLTISLLNSDFTQPAYRDNPERKRAYARRVARSFYEDMPTSEEQCVFTGRPALGVPLTLKEGKEQLSPGRAFRQHIPLVTGEGVINFAQSGEPGVPVSGIALLCLQFFPLGCQKCGGRLLAVHSDNADILLEFARSALHQNMRAISQAQITNETKFPEAPMSAYTLIISTLLDLSRRQRDELEARQPFSITAYHLTNSGQSSPLDVKSPPLAIYTLPMDTIRFLRMLSNPKFKPSWDALVQRHWAQSKVKRTDDAERKERRRNYVYEDLFLLPDQARRFLRTYFLTLPKGALKSLLDNHDSREGGQQLTPISWDLTELFLYEVMHMQKHRIEHIRELGDSLAVYVATQNDDRFFRNLSKAKYSYELQNLLIRVSNWYTKTGKGLLFGLDTYCSVFFEEDGDTLQMDWRLARDLLLIRMIEWFALNTDHWLEKHTEALPDDNELEAAISVNEN